MNDSRIFMMITVAVAMLANVVHAQSGSYYKLTSSFGNTAKSTEGDYVLTSTIIGSDNVEPGDDVYNLRGNVSSVPGISSSAISVPSRALHDPISPGTLACNDGENYGVACMTCAGGPRDGLFCLDGTDCSGNPCEANPSMCPGGTCGGIVAGAVTTIPYPKSRFIGFKPNVDDTWVGQEVAIRVTLSDIGPDAACNGEIRYAGAPTQFCEGGACTTMFWASELQSTPHFMDWTSIGAVQLYGEEVVSDSHYVIQAVDVSSTGDLTNDDNFSVPGLIVDTAKWGDVDVPLSGFTSASQPSISDVLKLVDKWLGNLEPRKSRTQLQPAVINPTASVGIADVLKGVDAWLGTPYPFSITTCIP